MRGTPGFVGDRLREAREVRGLTAVALSELVDVSPQSISLYEKGKSSPTPETLRAIAAAMNLPEHFFIQPERGYQRGAIFFRSMSAATKAARTRAGRRLSWLRDITRYVSEFVELPRPNLPQLDLPDDPLMLSNEDIEYAAEQTRRHWGMHDGPIANMVLLLENQGAVITRDRFNADMLDSLSEFAPDEQRPYLAVGTDRGTPVRWRFDVGHELGHLVLHPNVQRERLVNAAQHKQIEEQAHRFAAAFLLPLTTFADDFFMPNLDALAAIKPKWKVSIAMMITRAFNAGFISETERTKAWVNMSRRGWRRFEPYDDSMETEMPRLLRRSFELILNEGPQTPEDVVGSLALAPTDVETLSGLRAGFLGGFARVSLRQVGTDDDRTVVPLRQRVE